VATTPSEAQKRKRRLEEGVADFDDFLSEAERLLGPYVDPRVKYWLSTGITPLDLSICAGLPGGRLCEIWGDTQSGKTLLALSIAKQAHRLGGYVLWLDAEARFSVSLAQKLVRTNIDDRFVYRIPDDLESALNAFERMAVIRRRAPEPTVLVLDSVAALSLHDQGMDEKKNIEDAKQKLGPAATFANFFRRGILRKLAGSNVYLLFLNQVRDNIQFFAGYGPKKPVRPGGKAIPFFTTTSIQVSQLALDTKEGKTIGTTLVFKIEKNTHGPPNHVTTCPFYYISSLSGIQDEIACLNHLIKMGAIKKKANKNGEGTGILLFEGEELRKMELRERMLKDADLAKRIRALVQQNL
jgi:RecA/RadA recombinase